MALLLLPVILGGWAFADEIGQALPATIGGKEAYSPSYYSMYIFCVSIFIGVGAGLISGCIGAGGLFTVASLDRIVVLSHGRVVEDGTHHELVEAGGEYAGLWDRQTGGFLEGADASEG